MINSDNSTECDVVVIGGGPGGSTISALLADMGWSVILFEKDQHPRFHIGESLLPMNLPILERLGVLNKVHDIGLVKYGAEFNLDAHHNKKTTFYFKNAMDKNHPYAYQVRRSEFDQILLQNSASKGVEVFENTRVTDADFTDEKYCIVHTRNIDEQECIWKARYVIDASGRSTFLSNKFDLKRKSTHHNSASIFGHFEAVERRHDIDEGNISIYWFKHGWFWMIPLRDGIMSVGAVCSPDYLATRKSEPMEFLWETIKLCPDMHERMKNARLVGEARATGNYSYLSEKTYGKNYLMIGDAFAFVDPVFSSGVYFAMNSACMAVDVVNSCLKYENKSPKMLIEYDNEIQKGLRTFSWFIYRFTSPAMQNMFMSPKNLFHMEEAVLSMLSGDVFRNIPVKFPISLFKVFYYITSIFNFRCAWANYKSRQSFISTIFSGETAHRD